MKKKNLKNCCNCYHIGCNHDYCEHLKRTIEGFMVCKDWKYDRVAYTFRLIEQDDLIHGLEG